MQGSAGAAIVAPMSQPAILNVDRFVTYTPVGATGPFPVPFPVFDAAGADLGVTLDGSPATGWTFSGTQVDGFYGAPNTWVSGSITFAEPISGALEIDGDRAPRRIAQFQEGRGVPARDLNTELNIVTAIAREIWRRARALKAWVTDLKAEIDALAVQLNALLPAFFAYVSAAQQAAADAKSWAEQPYGEPVSSDPDGRSALHWQEVAHQWATEAKIWAETVGGQIYDFGLLSEATTSEEDWGTL